MAKKRGRKPASTTKNVRLKGVVKWFDTTKGVGFIETEDGNDIFVHHSELEGDLKVLKQDQKVEFEIVEGKRGAQAGKVKVISE